MWFKFISYLKFLFKSTNEHGVHSPFVFNYVTKCLYSKKKLNRDKGINALLKSISYFNIKNVESIELQNINELIQKQFPTIQFGTAPFDLIIVDNLEVSTLENQISEGKLHNDSMIWINSIYANKETLVQWEAIINSPLISVSINMHHCGVLFFRKEQVKEHFTIRI
ncbi:hypothetical protein [Flagellimonas zhangzhouensis]|uniref:Uncharacterized protein n=1 Tax=Flagellimonas zhangzhouensis TaxID=1073328 RepID=A0A1H2R0T8_9FLAO|nr:hypothetical protein [Allomuricauda zhangzhouensis]SDQ58630.1 hypothetical protein SAMN05216294_1787 [Allomuricauda zhangzhouensis]SDW13017.1 hypothetical protein SAMN04487892_0438 [Allomuricauda zhangzhouensis]